MKNIVRCIELRRSKTVFGKSLLAATLFILILPISTQAQYVTCYTDVFMNGSELSDLSWLNINDPSDLAYLDSFPTGDIDTPPTSVQAVAFGCTEDYYNSYNHTYWVTSTLYGPGGVLSTSTGLPAYTSTYFDAYSPEGSYYVDSEHFFECPNSPGSTSLAGYTSATLSVNINNSMFLSSETGPAQLPTGRWVRFCFYRNCSTNFTNNFCFLPYYDRWTISTSYPGTCTVGEAGMKVLSVHLGGSLFPRCADAIIYTPNQCP